MTPDFLSAAAEALFLSIPEPIECIYCDKCTKEIQITSDCCFHELTCCEGCERSLCDSCYYSENKMTRDAQLDSDIYYCKCCWEIEKTRDSDAIWADALAALPVN